MGICKISCGHYHCDCYCLCEMMQRDLSQHGLIPLVCSALVRIQGGVLPRIYMCWSQSLESHLHRYMSLSVRLREWCRVQVAEKVGSHVFCVALVPSDGDSWSHDSCPEFWNEDVSRSEDRIYRFCVWRSEIHGSRLQRQIQSDAKTNFWLCESGWLQRQMQSDVKTNFWLCESGGAHVAYIAVPLFSNLQVSKYELEEVHAQPNLQHDDELHAAMDQDRLLSFPHLRIRILIHILIHTGVWLYIQEEA